MKQKDFNAKKAIRFRRFDGKAYSAFNSMRRVVNIGVLVGCVLTSAHLSTASAQSATTPLQRGAEAMEEELDEVMVTASRIATPVNQTAKLVTVITREEIAQAPVQSIQDLLLYTANIDVVQRGGHGVQADISIRGGSFDQNAILLNGINLSSPHTGHYSLDIPVNLSDIERIEIIHGPSALIYGASAFSGGVNIITKKSADTNAYARIEGGMHDLRSMEIRGASQLGIATTSLSAGYSSSDGYTDNTDYDLYNLLLQTRLQFNTDSRLDLNLGYNDKKYGANSFYTAKFPNQYEQTSTYMGSLKGEFGRNLKVIPILYWDRHTDQFDLTRGEETGRNHHRGDTYGANLIMQYTSKLGSTSLGGEVRREDMISTVLGEPLFKPHGKYTKYDDRTNTSATIEHTLRLSQFVISAGVLMNHNTLQSGTYKFFPSASIAYRPTEKTNIFTTWGKSTRMPTFTDLYYTTETHESNNGLKPERSQSVDLGFKYKDTFINAYLTGFLMWGRDIIDWVKVEKPNGDVVSASWNHTSLDTEGVEMGVRFNLAQVLPALGTQASLAFDYTRMHQTCDTKGEASLFKLNYLRDKFTTSFNHQIYKGLSAGWYLRYQKRMGQYDAIENKENLGRKPYHGFSTLDVKLNYKYENLSLYVNLNNLYDTQYHDIGNIPQAGFWLIGGISFLY